MPLPMKIIAAGLLLTGTLFVFPLLTNVTQARYGRNRRDAGHLRLGSMQSP
jgi:hypothetical protein